MSSDLLNMNAIFKCRWVIAGIGAVDVLLLIFCIVACCVIRKRNQRAAARGGYHGGGGDGRQSWYSRLMPSRKYRFVLKQQFMGNRAARNCRCGFFLDDCMLPWWGQNKSRSRNIFASILKINYDL